jgi:predicted 3-demethylubiquinone-9 3-methyltransferase (glyoxalase superfamily)
MTDRPFTTCLWFDGQAEQAAQFYLSIFPKGVAGEATRGPDGAVIGVDFEINGQKFFALNGGPQFTFTEAVSFQIHCKDQEEVDYYWDRLTDGGEPGPCGWLKDRFGVSWQVVPEVFRALLNDPDPEKAGRATRAAMSMHKLDIAALTAAHAGA